MAENPTLCLQIALQANVPIILWGPPGVGKTSVTEQLAAAYGWPIHTEIATLSEPSEIVGFRMLDTIAGECRRYPTPWVKRFSKKTLGNKEAILFLDEFSCAPPSTQNACLRLPFERYAGDTELGPGLRFVLAANPTDTTTGAYDLTAPMSNRLYHQDFDLTTSAFVAGMRSGWSRPNIITLPPNWQARKSHWDSLIATFIECNPKHKIMEPTDDTQRGKAWPSPRSWDKLGSKLMAASESFGLDVQMQVLSGCVGEGSAIECTSWIRNLDLPNPPDVLIDPTLIQRPNAGQDHKVYAIMGAVMAYLREHGVTKEDNNGKLVTTATPEMWNQAWQVITHVYSLSKDLVIPFALTMWDLRPPGAHVPPAGRVVMKDAATLGGMFNHGGV